MFLQGVKVELQPVPKATKLKFERGMAKLWHGTH